MDLLRQFNKYSNDQQSLVQKALLTSATGVGEALIPQHLEKIITNLAVRLSPEIAVITPRYDAQKYHEFNRLTTLPGGGGSMGEGATTPTRASDSLHRLNSSTLAVAGFAPTTSTTSRATSSRRRSGRSYLCKQDR